MPDLQTMFNDSKDKIPAQRTLSNVIYNSAHIEHQKTLTAIDATNGDGVTTIPHREINRFVSISQAHSGDWCTVCTDGTPATTPRSDQTRTAMARRHGLCLKGAVEVIDELRASDDPKLKEEGFKHDYLGDHLCNTVLLGDKDKEAKSKSPLVSFNAGHVTDIVEPGGGPGGCDRLFEGKVVSPCVENPYQTGDMKGTKPPKIAHLYGFGNTEEKYRVQVYGCKERGRPRDGPLDHATGKGWVKKVEGEYDDCLKTGKGICRIVLIEAQGGVSPHTRASVRLQARRASAKGAIDRTRYGRARASPKSFYTHHIQRMSKAVVMEDAKHIRKQVNCHRQWLHYGAQA